MKDASGNVLTGRAVSWTSSNNQVATVSASGVVTGVGPGSATITATSETKTGTAAIAVTAPSVSTVSVASNTGELTVGQTTTLTATPKDASGNALTGRTVTWSSSNDAKATVSSSGVVTGVSPGSVTITATSEGRSGSTTLNVRPAPVGSVDVSPLSKSLLVGQTTTFSPTVKDVNGAVVNDRPVTWASENTSIATVSAAGVVTAIAPGNTTITATSESKSGQGAVTVNLVVGPVATVAISPNPITIKEDQTLQLVVTLKDAGGNVVTGRPVSFSSDENSIAMVDNSAVLHAKKQGMAVITATSDGKSGTVAVKVTK